MPEYHYTATEYDPDRPWIVVGTSHGQVTLDDDARFFAWAAEHWPAPRWRVELEPWQIAPEWQGSAKSATTE